MNGPVTKRFSQLVIGEWFYVSERGIAQKVNWFRAEGIPGNYRIIPPWRLVRVFTGVWRDQMGFTKSVRAAMAQSGCQGGAK